MAGVYVDELFDWPGAVAPKACIHGTRWSHLWCDPGCEDELHRLAASIGLKRKWFQVNLRLCHYDLTPSKRVKALRAGATSLSLWKWLTARRQAQRKARQ